MVTTEKSVDYTMKILDPKDIFGIESVLNEKEHRYGSVKCVENGKLLLLNSHVIFEEFESIEVTKLKELNILPDPSQILEKIKWCSKVNDIYNKSL